MTYEQAFYACAIGGIILSICGAGLGLVWIFGGNEVREQIKKEW